MSSVPKGTRPARRARSGFAPLHPVAALLLGQPARWAFAGGWALDLHLGAVGRPHDDVDVAVVDAEATVLLDALQRAGADVTWAVPASPGAPEARPRRLGEAHPGPGHQAHARWAGVLLDVVLEPWTRATWRYRRDPAVTLPLERAVVRRPLPGTSVEVPVLAAAPVLLFKATTGGRPGPRPKDTDDLARVVAALSPADRGWLRAALAATAPDHPWIAAGGPLT